jgi:hypothetical protein
MACAEETVLTADVAENGVELRVLELNHFSTHLAVKVLVVRITVIVLVKHARPNFQAAE